jgi:hypothetical protein
MYFSEFFQSVLEVLEIICYILLFSQRAQRFKVIFFLLLSVHVSVNTFTIVNHIGSFSEDLIELVTDFACSTCVVVFLIQTAHYREVKKRVDFNRHVMMRVESKRNMEVA